MPNPNTKGISVHVDRELHAEITAYLQENNMKMADFIALAAQELLRPLSMKIDPELKAEIDAYLEENNVTMAEFITQAAQSQLHPYVPGIGGELQADINAYLEEHDMAMDEFFTPVPEFYEGEQGEGFSEGSEAPVSGDSPENGYGDQPEEGPAVGDSEGGFEPVDEEETEQATPAPEYSEGELGTAVEVSQNMDYGQDEPPGFPEPDDEEETEDYGMNMAM